VRLGTVTSVSEERVEFALGQKVAAGSSAQLTLVLSIFKFDRMEWAVEKCTEIGVARIVPLIARRTDAHLAAAAVKRHERWMRIARSAAEQSRRASVPKISEPMKFKELLELSNGGWQEASRVVLAESENKVVLREAIDAAADEVVLAVGPEGGWTSDELRGFLNNGWASASLGPTILRAETAAIVGAAIALDVLI